MEVDDESWEEICLPDGTRMDVPSGIAENRDVLDCVFFPEVWQKFASDDLRIRLESLLPPGERPDDCRDVFVHDQDIRFGRNQLRDFKEMLVGQQMTPAKAGMRALLRKLESEQYGDKLAERAYRNVNDLSVSRKRKLDQLGAPSGMLRAPPSIASMTRKSVPVAHDVNYAVGKEYMDVLALVMKKLDGEGPKAGFKDVLYPNGLPSAAYQEGKRPNVRITIKDFQTGEKPVTGNQTTLKSPKESNSKRLVPIDLPKNKSLLAKGRSQVPSRPTPNQPTAPLGSDEINASSNELPKLVEERNTVAEAVANIPTESIQGVDANIKSAEDIPQQPSQPGQQVLPPCFFSLVRDTITSNGGDTASFRSLESAIRSWTQMHSKKCQWVTEQSADHDWSLRLPSAVAFLCGDFGELLPPDFHPYLKVWREANDANDVMCRWVGASRDSDVELGALTKWWMDKILQGKVHTLADLVSQNDSEEIEERKILRKTPQDPSTALSKEQKTKKLLATSKSFKKSHIDQSKLMELTAPSASREKVQGASLLRPLQKATSDATRVSSTIAPRPAQSSVTSPTQAAVPSKSLLLPPPGLSLQNAVAMPSNIRQPQPETVSRVLPSAIGGGGAPKTMPSTVSLASNQAIRQPRPNPTTSQQPQQPSASSVQIPVMAADGGLQTTTIPYLNLTQSPASEVMKIISGMAAQPPPPQQQQEQRQYAPQSLQPSLASPTLQQQTLPPTLRPPMQPQQPPAPPPVPVRPQQVLQQVRLSTPLPVGQRVSINGRQYLVAGTDATGQQAVLSPCVEQQQPQQQIVVQPQQQIMVQQQHQHQQIVVQQQQQPQQVVMPGQPLVLQGQASNVFIQHRFQ